MSDDLVIGTIGIASAAFFVWLVVRAVNRRDRWAGRTTGLIIGLSILYVASFGPACWISSRTGVGVTVVSAAYAPLTWNFGNAIGRRPTPIIGLALSRYADLAAAPHWWWLTSSYPIIGFTWEWTDVSVKFAPMRGPIATDGGTDAERRDEEGEER